MAIALILNLDTAWQITQRITEEDYQTDLGDGYRTGGAGGLHFTKEEWDVSKTGLTEVECDALVAELKEYAGWRPFRWRADEGSPYKTYTCAQWEVSEVGVDVWRVSGSFQIDESGQCEAYRDLIDEVEIGEWVAALDQWLTTYTRSTQPMIMNAQYLVVNAFHTVLGRGGYFQPTVGTSEGMFLMIHACCEAFKLTGNTSWRDRAVAIGNAAVQYLYRASTIPAAASTSFFPHWAFVVKAPTITKGKTAPKYLNYGHFDVIVNFTNGVGQIPAGSPNFGQNLSNAYSVYSLNGKLLWQNLFAPVKFGTNYSIQYWVSNYLLEGQVFRVYPDTESSAGTSPTPTNESPGTIRLNSNYTGQLKIAYATYEPSIILQVNEKADFYPVWRRLQAGEINVATDSYAWAYSAYVALNEVTGDERWQRAASATAATAIQSANIPNLTAWNKLDDSERWDSYPGVQIIQTPEDNPAGYTASRVTSGALKDFIQIQVNAASASVFPTIEAPQNFAVHAKLASNSRVRASVASSVDILLQVQLSLNPDPFNFTQIYTALWLVNAGTTAATTRTFLPGDFIRYDSYLVWYPTCADNPIYVFSGGGGSSTATMQQVTITEGGNDYRPVVWRIDMNAGGGFAGSGFVLIHKTVVKPPLLYYQHSGSDVNLRIKDASDNLWDYTIESTGGDWKKLQPKWDDFDRFSGDDDEPDDSNSILAIELHSIAGEGTSTTRVAWIAADTRNDAERLDPPVQTYKAAIVSKRRAAHTLFIGEFAAIDSPSDALAYTPGVIPYTTNTINDEVDAYIGTRPMAGYQSARFYQKTGYAEHYRNVLRFWKDAQAAYANQNVNRTTGPFIACYIWPYWENGEYRDAGLIDTFSWDSIDVNFSWEGYQGRPLSDAAEALYYEPTNTELRRIVMTFLGYLDSYFLRNNTIQPPTNYPAVNDPYAAYNCPHQAVHILRAAVYANLAGQSPSITMRLITKMLRYLRSQYQDGSTVPTMRGTFTRGQPAFSFNGVNYSEAFGFWIGEEILSLCALLKFKNQLNMPPCSVTL